MRRRDLLAGGAAALSARALMPSAAFAQSRYPERSIRLVVPFPPGGGFDAVARPWAEKMKTLLGTVVGTSIGLVQGYFGGLVDNVVVSRKEIPGAMEKTSLITEK